MPTCLIIAALVTCTGAQPLPPKAAARVLSASVPQVSRRAPVVPSAPPWGVEPAQRRADVFPYFTPTKPLAEPWSVTVHRGMTYFNGTPVGFPERTHHQVDQARVQLWK